MFWIVVWSGLALVSVMGVIASANSVRFQRAVASEVRELSSAESRPSPLVALDNLPAPVRRYLNKAIGSRQHALKSARLRHGGTFRTSLDGRWFPIRGEQYFSADPPGFVWWGRIRLAPGFWVDARDRCSGGVGNMRISLESTVTLGDNSGPQMDQGAMIRLLGEMAWFPTAYLDERHVTWAAMDDRRARASLKLQGREVAAVFEFADDGLPLRVSAERYRLEGGKNVLTPWSGEYGDYRNVDGLLVPHLLAAFWHVEGNRVPVLRFLVEELKYDVSPP